MMGTAPHLPFQSKPLARRRADLPGRVARKGGREFSLQRRRHRLTCGCSRRGACETVRQACGAHLFRDSRALPMPGRAEFLAAGTHEVECVRKKVT